MFLKIKTDFSFFIELLKNLGNIIESLWNILVLLFSFVVIWGIATVCLIIPYFFICTIILKYSKKIFDPNEYLLIVMNFSFIVTIFLFIFVLRI